MSAGVPVPPKMGGVYAVRPDGTVVQQSNGREQPFMLPEDLVPARLRQGAALGLLLFMCRTGAKAAGREVFVEDTAPGETVFVRVSR